MLRTPEISVLIPFFDDEEHIERCANSVLTQTMPNLDIIFVNDGSSDRSEEILRRAVGNDDRVRILSHGANRGIVQARKTGILAAIGDHVMFLDADDMLSPRACEISLAYAKQFDVDILHFSTEVHPRDDYSTKFEKNLAPYPGRLQGVEILTACYGAHQYEHALWNKIYRIGPVLQAAECMKDVYLNYAEDYYIYFLISLFSQSYHGLTTEPLHFYQSAGGMTDFRKIGAREIELMISISRVHELIEDHLRSADFPQHGKSLPEDLTLRMRSDSITAIVQAWYFANPSNSITLMDKLIDGFSPFEVAIVLCNQYHHSIPQISRRLRGTQFFAPLPVKPSKIGIYYHRLRSGGGERVAAVLANLWAKMGYPVVLFTDEAGTPEDYDLPIGVERVVLPPLLDNEAIAEHRLRALKDAVETHDIGVMVHHNVFTPRFFLDCMLLKSLGIPVVGVMHGVCAASMSWLGDAMLWQQDVLAAVDRLVVLSRVDLLYFKALGVRATFIPNPLPWEIGEVRLAPLDAKNVLWAGRLHWEKRPFEALEVFARATQHEPDAKLYLVGGADSEEDLDRIKAKILELGIADRVVLAGYQRDMRPFYEAASVTLITSRLESFCMVLLESKAHGVPTVMFDMPNLELLAAGSGVIRLQRDDTRGAVDAVSRLLGDKEYRRELGAQSRASAVRFLDDNDIPASWRSLFDGIGDDAGLPDVTGQEEFGGLKSVLETVLFAYRDGLESRYS